MTGLADALRERLSRRGRTAQADCGALGVLTVEALSPGDCAALLRRGGKRAVLYAACRELQRAGEDLRQEGRVYTPEEIMEYVSEGELSAAVAAVLSLSGAEGPEGGGAAETEEPDKPEEAEEPEQPGGPEEPPASPPAEGPGGQKAPEAPGPAPAASGGGREIRLGDVQEFREAVPEIRHGFVRDGGGQGGRGPGAAAPRRGEIRPGIVRERPGQPGPEGPEPVGQVSRETEAPAAIFRPKAAAGKKPQAFVPGAENRAQNVAKATEGPGVFRQKAARPEGKPLAAAQAGRPDFREGMHETTSEFQPGGRAAAQVAKSEFPEGMHETTSEFQPGGRAAAHETRPEFPEGMHEARSEFPEGMHETTSEFQPGGGAAAQVAKSEFPEGMHEIKPESAGGPEMTAALAERAAEFLLEGLRRAAGAR